MARFDRVLELSAQLQRTREPQSLESLMAHMGVSRATLNRLIGVLRNEAGFDVQYVKEQGYVLQRSPRDTLATKLLELNSADVANLLVAEALLDQLTPGLLRDETASLRKALEKLNAKRLGDADMRRRLQLRLNHLRPTSQKGFNVLLNALLTQRQVSFDYHSRNEDRSSRRLCSPQRLTFYRNNWYLSAWCHERDALRLFSVDRISEPRLSRDDAQQPDATTGRQLRHLSGAGHRDCSAAVQRQVGALGRRGAVASQCTLRNHARWWRHSACALSP